MAPTVTTQPSISTPPTTRVVPLSESSSLVIPEIRDALLDEDGLDNSSVGLRYTSHALVVMLMSSTIWMVL
jgi:hypothetical protein